MSKRCCPFSSKKLLEGGNINYKRDVGDIGVQDAKTKLISKKIKKIKKTRKIQKSKKMKKTRKTKTRKTRK